MDREAYKFLGNFNAAVDWAAVTLYCDPCRVSWIGCWDNAACPVCGNSDSWDDLMKVRGHYKPNIEQLRRAAG